MAVEWTTQFIKYVLYLINVLFVISGIILIAVGATIKSYYNTYDIFLNSNYFDLPNLLVAIGVLIFLISIIGVFGTYRESWQWILIFSVFLGLIFVMEISGGIAGYALKDKTENYIKKELLASMDNYDFNKDKVNSNTKMWDFIQEKFECCGANNAIDWTKHKPPSPPTIMTTLPTTPTIITTVVTTPTTPSTTKPIPTNTTTPNSTIVSIQTINEAYLGAALKAAPPTDRNATLDLPASCCKPKPGATGTILCTFQANSTDTATYFKTGCVKSFGNFLKRHASSLGGVGIGIAVLQLVAVIFSYSLSKKLRTYVFAT